MYEKKTLELKVEFYQDEKAEGHRSRKRMGVRELNLSDYIGKPPKFECLRLDLNNKTQYVYLTYMIHVTDDLTSDGGEEVREAEETTFLGAPPLSPMAKQSIARIRKASSHKPVTMSDDEDEPGFSGHTYNSSMTGLDSDEEEEKRGND